MRADGKLCADDVLHQTWERLESVLSSSTTYGIWHKEALLSYLRFRDVNESLTALLRFVQVTDQDMNAHLAHVHPDYENPADPRAHDIPVSEFVHCPHCTATFPTVCGLRHHIGRKHGQALVVRESPIAMTPEHIRSLGTNGLPICRRCGKRYVRWDEFSRHILEDRCHPLPGFVERPLALAQDNQLLKDLQSSWLAHTEKHPELLERMKVHCVLCNQWISRIASIGTHLSRQHPNEFQSALARYPHMMLDYGAPLTPPCLFCGSSFIKKHRCAVLLQIGILKVRAQLLSPTTPVEHDERRASHPKRDGHFSGNDGQGAHPTNRRRRRWKSAPSKEKQDLSTTEKVPIQTRSRACSQYATVGSAVVQARAETRRHDQHIQTGLLFYDLHEQQRSWSGPPDASGQREVESRTYAQSGDSYLSSQAHSVHGTDGGISISCQTTRRRIRGKRSMGQGPRSRHSQSGQSISLQEMGCRVFQAGSGWLPPSSSSRSTQDSDRHCKTSRAGNHSSLSCDETIICSDARTHDTLHAGDRSATSTCRPHPPSPMQVEQECDHRSHGNGIATIDSATQSVSTRSSGINQQNGEEIGDAWEDLWHCRLRNPGNHCYMIACVMALASTLLTGHGSWHRFGIVGRGIVEILQSRARHLLESPQWRMLLAPWAEIDMQHDVAEFLSFLLTQLSDSDVGRWSARLSVGEAVLTEDHGLLRQPLKLVPSGVEQQDTNSLQACIDSWHRDQGALHALDGSPPIVAIQLERFRVASTGMVVKTTWRCDLSEARHLHLPIFQHAESIAVRTCMYTLAAIILHHGESVQNGHYTSLLRHNEFWWHKDDDRPTNQLEGLTESQERNAYVLLLTREV